MRLLAALILLAVLAAAVAAAYIGYRQLETKRVMLPAAPAFAAREDGALCAHAGFEVEARAIGYWLVPVDGARALTGAVTVVGGDTADIGLRIFSPNNRLLFYTPQRSHHPEFALQADVRGEYRFEFDNRHSIFGKKQLDVSICLA